MNLQHLDWQTVVALMIVLAAIVVFARSTWQMIFKPETSGCGTGCGSCPSAESNGSVRVTELIQLDANSTDPSNR